MARDTELKIVIKAKNEAGAAFKSAGKNLNTLKGKLEKHQKAFKAMAVAGVAAMGAITLAVGTAVKEAAKAEGSYNKFNAVFGEHKDDMLEFVDDIRTRMPTATHEIVRMAANLQDLLVPLGLNRELAADMTKGFLEVSNQIAAFNDVDPTEVIEAIGSALAGSSEPLRRFGVNALETSLETRALEMGLINAGEGFKDLDVNVKNQIRAQALLAQIIDNSSDAIAGFEANNDSFIRRQQELNATIKETKKELGEAFLPAIDSVLKKLLPVVKQVSEWAKENKKLVPIITGTVMALAILVTVLGTLGLILPKIIALFTGASLAASLWIAIIVASMVVIGEFIAIGWILYHDWDLIIKGFTIMWQEHVEWVRNKLNKLKEYFQVAWTGIKIIFGEMWESIKTIVGDAIEWLMTKIQPFIDAFNIVKEGARFISEKAGTTPYSWAKEKILGEGQFGIPYVPKTGAYLLHRGEAVVPAGKGAGAITVNILGGTYLSPEAAEEIGDTIIERLKIQRRI